MTQTAAKLAEPAATGFDAWGTARPELNFVREYQLSDVSVCDTLVALFKTARELKLTQPGFTGRFQVNKAVKDSEDLAVERLPKNNPKIPTPDKSGYNAVMKQFMDFIPRYYKDTNAGWAQPVAFKALPHFQYYKPGGGYHAWHVDAFSEVVDRHLVFLLYLNDVPNGGTEFQLQKYVCEAKKGKVLMFPANFSFPHRSQISTTHEKYILTGWANAMMGQPPPR